MLLRCIRDVGNDQGGEEVAIRSWSTGYDSGAFPRTAGDGRSRI
jgi:hypothetical protein